MNYSWSKLTVAFQCVVANVPEPMGKSSDGILKVIYGNDYLWDRTYDKEPPVYVELGAYQISNWPRTTTLGPFATEAEAMKATRDKIVEASMLINQEIYVASGGTPFRFFFEELIS